MEATEAAAPVVYVSRDAGCAQANSSVPPMDTHMSAWARPASTYCSFRIGGAAEQNLPSVLAHRSRHHA